MHELSGKRVEVKSATPRGSGPVGGRGMLGDRRMLSHGASMGGRGMGMMPGQMSPQYGMNPYNAVGYAFPCYDLTGNANSQHPNCHEIQYQHYGPIHGTHTLL